VKRKGEDLEQKKGTDRARGLRTKERERQSERTYRKTYVQQDIGTERHI
jgi:hypothetical protein